RGGPRSRRAARRRPRRGAPARGPRLPARAARRRAAPRPPIGAAAGHPRRERGPHVIHHVALETRFEDAKACVAFYALLGFARVEPPETLRDRAVWLALGAQQVHLLLTDEPDVPPHGHVA